MKLAMTDRQPAGSRRNGSLSGFTLVEALFAFGICAMLLAGAMTFVWFSTVAVSGITAQTLVNQRAGNAIEFIQNRVRFATSISNDVTGNILTLGFDDNLTNDTSGDSIPYNDKDHFERFQFVGVNSTNGTLCASNQLVYFTNITSTTSNVLISAGVRNLPGYNIFSITNKVIAIVRFGVVDIYSLDHFQENDVQGTAISLNRPNTTNILSILP
jgi:type II secretory pathway pseudopilin PulG